MLMHTGEKKTKQTKQQQQNLGQERMSRGHISSVGKISFNAEKKLCFYTLPKCILFRLSSIDSNAQKILS